MTGFETWLAGMMVFAVGSLVIAYKLTQKKP